MPDHNQTAFPLRNLWFWQVHHNTPYPVSYPQAHQYFSKLSTGQWKSVNICQKTLSYIPGQTACHNDWTQFSDNNWSDQSHNVSSIILRMSSVSFRQNGRVSNNHRTETDTGSSPHFPCDTEKCPSDSHKVHMPSCLSDIQLLPLLSQVRQLCHNPPLPKALPTLHVPLS